MVGAGQGRQRPQPRRLFCQGARKRVLHLARGDTQATIQEQAGDGRRIGIAISGPRAPLLFLFFPPPIQVGVLAEGRTSCDDGIQCPVCLLLRAFLLLITKQPDALLPSVVLSLQRGVLRLRGTVMHNSIYSHRQPTANASCCTERQLHYTFPPSCLSARVFLNQFPSTLRGS